MRAATNCFANSPPLPPNDALVKHKTSARISCGKLTYASCATKPPMLWPISTTGSASSDSIWWRRAATTCWKS